MIDLDFNMILTSLLNLDLWPLIYQNVIGLNWAVNLYIWKGFFVKKDRKIKTQNL